MRPCSVDCWFAVAALVGRVGLRFGLIAVMQSVSARANAQVVEFRPPDLIFYGTFGRALSPIPDLDGDAAPDILIGAPDDGASPGRGRAFVFSGRSGALLATLRPPGVVGDFDYYGWSLVGLADLDNDARGDFVVGAEAEQSVAGGGGGVAHLYSGAECSYLRLLDFGGGELGNKAASVPDCNGDGFDDIILSAPVPLQNSSYGRAILASPRTGEQLALFQLAPGTVAAGYPSSVGGVPDIDGDGRGEVVIGCHTETIAGFQYAGRVYVFSGASGSLIRTLQADAPTREGYFGGAVAGCPDLDGDGRGDILVGCPTETPPGRPRYSGALHVYSGLTGVELWRALPPLAQTGAGFAASLAALPDWDGDGTPDVLIGSQLTQLPGQPHAGAAYIYSGRTGQLLRVLSSSHPEEWGYFGCAVAGLPDINGDGLGEALVGAYGESIGVPAQREGRAYLFLSCRADFNGDGVVNTADFFDFLGAFFAADADFNHSGATDSQDFFDYLVVFFGGCP